MQFNVSTTKVGAASRYECPNEDELLGAFRCYSQFDDDLATDLEG